MKFENITLEIDAHRWYYNLFITRKDGTRDDHVIGVLEGEPSLFSREEWDEISEEYGF